MPPTSFARRTIDSSNDKEKASTLLGKTRAAGHKIFRSSLPRLEGDVFSLGLAFAEAVSVMRGGFCQSSLLRLALVKFYRSVNRAIFKSIGSPDRNRTSGEHSFWPRLSAALDVIMRALRNRLVRTVACGKVAVLRLSLQSVD